MYEEIKTACLYLRYSSSNQTEQSIEGQMHVCQDFCKRHNIRIVEMYIDRATSASKDIEKRVEFLKMIKDSEKGNFNAVIVYKLDRFARSRYNSATYKYRLKRNGVQLISATENITQDPEGIILESVLEGMAEFYSAELSQKINRGMRESAMKHNSIGGAIPLGYKTVDKKLVIDETTAPIVREAFQMYADGESVAEICRTFNNRGYKTSKGTRFGKSSFTKIFRNEKYIGVYKYHDYRAEDVIPPIIDKDLWDRVQVRVGKIKKAPARNKARHTYLLTGKLFCGHCGSAMNADGNSQGYLYYRCYGKKNLDKQCNKRNMEKNLIERLVAQDAMSFLTDEYIEKIATIACDRNKQEIESDSPIPVIRDRIRQVDVSLNNLLKAIETGSAPDMLVKRMGELETEKKDMEVQLKKEMAHQVYIDKEQVIFWLEKFREGDINDEEFCQTVIDLFVNSVTVWDEPDDKFKITIAYNLTSIPQKTYRLSKDGRLSDYASNTPTQEGYKEGIEWLHKLVTEDLIDPEAFTQEWSTYVAKGKNHRYGLCFTWDIANIDNNTDYVMLPALTGPDGVRNITRQNNSETSGFDRGRCVLTSSCRDTALAAAWIDQMYAPIQSPQNNWGTYGEKDSFNIFEMSTNADGGQMLKHMDLGDQSPVEVREAQSVNGPLAVLNEYYDVYVTEPADAKWRLDNMHEAYLKDMNSKYVYPNVFMSIDDTNKVSQYDTDIKKYAEQKKADWILNGGIDKEWDSYLKKLDKYGLQDYLKIKQKYFDSYQKSLESTSEGK